MVRGTFLEAVIFEQRLQCERGSHVDTKGGVLQAKGTGTAKAPGAGQSQRQPRDTIYKGHGARTWRCRCRWQKSLLTVPEDSGLPGEETDLVRKQKWREGLPSPEPWQVSKGKGGWAEETADWLV